MKEQNSVDLYKKVNCTRNELEKEGLSSKQLMTG